jgi:hypothetical protein
MKRAPGAVAISDHQTIANEMNNFFVHSGASALVNNPATQTDPLSFVPKLSDSHTMHMRQVGSQEVLRILNELKDSSGGIDRLKPKVVREVRNEIVTPLKWLITCCLRRGVFPNMLKEAIITPIFKKGSKDIMSNYRPISVLNVFAKVIEKIIHDRLTSFVSATGILDTHQFGFRSGHSTELAITEVISCVYRALNKGQCTLAVNMDLSKAFDAIDHSKLLKKLELYGISGSALKLLTCYLTGRTQRVRYERALSSPSNVTQGVPQGSNLGPLLFILYINDFHLICQNSTSIMYADDCNVLFNFARNDVSIVPRVNLLLSNFADWFSCNRLALNISKTNYIVFSGKRRLVINGISINGSLLSQVNNANFLGITIDDTLTWKNHLAALRSKLSKSIGILRKLARHLSRSILLQLYNSFITPYLQYGITIWGSAPKTTLNPIFVLQKKALKIALDLPMRTSTEQVLRTAKVLPLSDMYKLRVGIFMYKFNSLLLPSCFLSYFQANSQVHSINTRSSSLFRLPLFTTTKCQQSILFQGPKIWSLIPAPIRSAISLVSFKKRLKAHLLDQL